MVALTTLAPTARAAETVLPPPRPEPRLAIEVPLRLARLDPLSSFAETLRPSDAVAWGRVAAGPNVFGSVAVPFGRVAASARWRALLAEKATTAFETCERALPAATCASGKWARWDAAAKAARALDGAEKLAYVNAAVNRLVAYRSDAALYGKRDHWASFAEIVVRGAGDCEDYALAKVWLLAAAGVPMEAMQVTVLRDTRRKLDHAVLAVHVDGESWILDNVRNRIVRDDALADYKPLYSVSAHASFIHGRSTAPTQRVARLQ
ncbi:MAG: transglutaminase-like cysteine peptidase [Salinarimonas sp.]